jgi:cytochrome P450
MERDVTVSPVEAVATKREIPKTSGFPVVGSIPNLLRKQTDFLFEAWREYGDIYKLDLGIVNIVILNHPDYAQYIMRDNFRNYDKGGKLWDAVRTLVGDGLVTAEGEHWRRQRRMMQPQFHRQHLASLTNHMVEAIEDGMSEWDSIAASGEAFNIAKAFNKITMNVIVRTMFGTDLNSIETDEMGNRVDFVLSRMLQEMVLGSLPDWIPVPGRVKYQEAIAYIDKYIYSLIEKRRREPNHENADVLTMLLNLVDDETGEQMSDKQLRDEAITVFLAGYETTSVSMTWASYMMTQYPEVAQKLAAHVDNVLEGQIPKFEDLMQLTYPRMVMEEVMRLSPPVFFVARTAVEDDMIGGYPIKAGDFVAIIPLTIHRHPDFWQDADKFDPERFTPENIKGRHPQAWLPFGAGQRSCIGKDFALMEGPLILTRLAQRYTLKAVPEHQPKPAMSMTLSTKDGAWLKLAKR